MVLVQLFLLAAVQGITEFLPISSSAHLVLVPILFSWPDQGLAFDVAVHFGSLFAVLVYFRNELRELLRAVLGFVGGERDRTNEQLLTKLIVATVPVVVVGYFAKPLVEANLRSLLVIGTTTLAFGILLGVADRAKEKTLDEQSMTLVHAFYIGCAQVLALIPGTSRSGITITCALFLGFSRTSAARFSFLLSIPTIIAAAFLTGMEAVQSAESVNWSELLLGLVVAGVCSYVCIDAFIRFVNRIGMFPFVIYRFLLGAGLLLIALLGSGG